MADKIEELKEQPQIIEMEENLKSQNRVKGSTTRYNKQSIMVLNAMEELDLDELTRDDFDIVRNLGKGAYGTVYQVEHKKTK